MIKFLNHLTNKERLRELGPFVQPREEKAQRNLINAYKYLMVGCRCYGKED